MPQITELYAWVMADTGPDDEGIPAFTDPLTGYWMPMMGADLERAESLRPQAEEFARATGKPVKLIRSTSIEVVETVDPFNRPIKEEAITTSGPIEVEVITADRPIEVVDGHQRVRAAQATGIKHMAIEEKADTDP